MNTLHDIFGRPVLFHLVLWHGKNGPSLTGYDSRDPSVISRQLKAMQAFGGAGAGVIALTYGPTVSPFIHEACMAVGNQANALGMPFGLCFDPWTVKGASDPNTAMISALQHPDIQFLLNMPTYLKGKPVLDFATGCDKNTVLAAVPNIAYWQAQKDFDWPQIPQVPNQTPLPCAYIEFNDGTGPDRNKQVWDQSQPARIVPSLAGRTFWNRSVGVSAYGAYVQFCTWNDVSEGTDVEKFASIWANSEI